MGRIAFFAFGVVIGFVAIAGFSSALNSSVKYRVFCANGKIEVGMRSLAEMKSMRGSNTCQFGEYDALSDANSSAENQGGIGTPCSCE